MEETPTPKAVRIARVVVQTVLILASVSVGLAMLAAAVVFGDCAGWKGAGTCPRVPFWDWEVFRIAFAGGALPVAVTRFAIKPNRNRLLRAVAEGVAAGLLVGALVVAATAT